MTDLEFYSLLALILLMILMVAGTGCSPLQMFRKASATVTFAKVSQAELDQFVEDMKDNTLLGVLVNLKSFFLHKMKYVPDGIIDYPRDPRVTLLLKSGDCDDAASLALYVLRKLGYDNAVMVSVFSHTEGHSYCYIDGYAIGNWGLQKFNSIEEANDFFIKDFKCAYQWFF